MYIYITRITFIYKKKKITRITFFFLFESHLSIKKKNNSNHIYLFKSNLDLSIDPFVSKLKTTHTHGFLAR